MPEKICLTKPMLCVKLLFQKYETYVLRCSLIDVWFPVYDQKIPKDTWCYVRITIFNGHWLSKVETQKEKKSLIIFGEGWISRSDTYFKIVLRNASKKSVSYNSYFVEHPQIALTKLVL